VLAVVLETALVVVLEDWLRREEPVALVCC
jgi:hypothetical protein